ncbi:MAG: hypothetical protein K2M00_02900 [Muribaculaceae bacterium]|nr:hypothetical protein [Muribaculaceae bacterium]
MKHLLTALLAIVWFNAWGSYTIVEGRLDNSDIYPGTVHRFRVSVPDSHDFSTPAALYLGLDGILCNAPAVIDSLMQAGVVPPMVGVYLEPGYVPGDSIVLRYNRSNEFDATDARFASFIEKELLPAVENLDLPDGRHIKLSPRGADHMIFGLSSGGIAAFNAAWHRPDLFSKVFSGCGTFVPMRGAHDLEAIVRKHEPLPLRIFLQDGYTDTWNPIFGSWYEHNRLLASALEFAGYDCAFDWAEGGHSVRRASEIFPEVMTWLWREGEPAPGTTGNGLLAPMLDGAGDWNFDPVTVSAAPAGNPEAVYPDGSLVAVSVPGSNFIDQYLIDAAGQRVNGQRYYWLHSYDNSDITPASMTFDGNGYLWVVTRAGIQICDQNGRVRGILRLPDGIIPSEASITVSDGTVTLSSPAGSWTRRLAVKGAVPGERPRSEGPA